MVPISDNLFLPPQKGTANTFHFSHAYITCYDIRATFQPLKEHTCLIIISHAEVIMKILSDMS